MTEHHITLDDAGTTIKVAPGDLVVLELPENPTTGYEWVMSVEGSVQVVEDDRDAPASPTPGASVTRRFAVRPDLPGRSSLILRRQRSWETGQPIETVEVVLDAS
jgi:inhibitor of cysteine peptidase